MYRLREQMLQDWPERSKSITEAMEYLMNNLEAIAVIQRDEEAGHGGATEPHVSHVLSSRLSSRPMGWSEETLKRLVPLLVAGAGRIRMEKNGDEEQAVEAVRDAKRTFGKIIPFSLGLSHPNLVACLPARAGKVTPLFRALRPF